MRMKLGMPTNRPATAAVGLCLALLLIGTGVVPALAADPAPPSATAAPPAVQDREEPIRYRRPSFNYEQCANQCQLERDRGMTACLVADNPNKPKYAKPADCSDGGHTQYKACLARCPADTENP
jgi:hypothetical protein